MIKYVAERSTSAHCTASVNQPDDWTKTPADHRELPHLFTGLLVSLLFLSTLQHAPWQHAVQSQGNQSLEIGDTHTNERNAEKM